MGIALVLHIGGLTVYEIGSILISFTFMSAREEAGEECLTTGQQSGTGGGKCFLWKLHRGRGD